jgi:hypothetical protein
MNESPAKSAVGWLDIGTGVLVGGLLIAVQVVHGWSMLEFLGAVVFGTGLAGIIWLWHITVRDADIARTLTRGERVWNAGVFVSFLGVMAWVGWRMAW